MTGPAVVCVVRLVDRGQATSRCGSTIQLRGRSLHDAGMTGWESDRTCPACSPKAAR